VFGLFGFAVGVVILALVWSPHSIPEWFIASLIPGAVAYKLGSVPEDYSPPRAFGIFAGLWAALFWLPIGVAIVQQLGLIA